MNKTVTINLGGIVFHIDEEAYFELSKYLKAIKQSFKKTESGDEIIADIELRIAELFKEKLSFANIQVVSMTDVKAVISVMGKPEDYLESENQIKDEQDTAEYVETPYTSTKQMFRDTDNKILGGVCSGLAAYFGADPIIFRVIFGVLFFTGLGILLYLFLWIATPAAKTEDDKNKMRGEYTSSKKTFSYKTSEKRLYRDPDDKILAGVCSGLGAYFSVDPVFFRLAFVAVTFLGFGTGVLLYIILAIVLPKALTTADKLKMRGEPININNIKKTFEEDAEDLKKKVKDFGQEVKELGKSEHAHKFRNFIRDFFELFIQALGGFIKIAGKLLGGILIFFSFILIVALIASFFIGSPGIYIEGESQSIANFQSLIFNNPTLWYLGLISLFLLIGIPLISFLTLGVKLLFKVETPSKKIGFPFSALWVIGLIMGAYVAAMFGKDFMEKGKENEQVYIQDVDSDTLFLDVKNINEENESENKNIRINGDIIFMDNEQFSIADVDFDIVQSSDEHAALNITRIAKGNSKDDAQKRAHHIIYHFEQKDSLLLFDRFFSLAENEVWRAQEVNIVLSIPIGKTVYFSPNMQKIIYDIDNVSNTYDDDMVRHYWMMKPEGLTCIDYNFSMEEKL
jgi:phage shock protein PspC (stress-responsive transcriptional regulator)